MILLLAAVKYEPAYIYKLHREIKLNKKWKKNFDPQLLSADLFDAIIVWTQLSLLLSTLRINSGVLWLKIILKKSAYTVGDWNK